ncbi:mammalian ependymin-related protein 1-like [Mercenaria mercenaria]|uniref:mammalian ependymin-related protein 1-like n=1 Tax=Mercenaria mercenaria TaxID=6596 RepID=UPI00234F6858|nr:mammalian ependymin-related protein 1-like [Mercenaria mercenaria]
MKLYILFICLTVASCFSVKPAPICCFPDQFETFMFISQGVVDVPSGKLGYGYGYANATVRTAFDGINQLTYAHEHSMSFMSIYPVPIVLDSANILDYKNNVQWRVYGDGSCDKLDVGLPLYPECIPANASLMSKGLLGKTGKVLQTFIFHNRIYLDPYEVTVTVIMSDDKEGECIPLRMSVSQAYVFDSDKNVDITVADIFDFTPGIKDISIFTPPSSCDKVTTIKESGSIKNSGSIRDILQKFADMHRNNRE